MKRRRQAKILELIEQGMVETQEELTNLLRQHGFDATQATVSRDIKDLRLVKILTEEGRYRYALSQEEGARMPFARLRTIFRESITSYEQAQNIVVIKTLPGLASAACSAIDSMQLPAVVGTLAGDDTAFLAMRSTGEAVAFCEEIHKLLQ